MDALTFHCHCHCAEYDHLKRFRKRLNGVTATESSPKYLDAVRELLGLESAKDVPTPSVPAHKEQLMTGEMVEPAESTVCWWATPLHAGQGRRALRGVNSWVNAREANPRFSGCCEACGSLLERNERLCQQA